MVKTERSVSVYNSRRVGRGGGGGGVLTDYEKKKLNDYF